MAEGAPFHNDIAGAPEGGAAQFIHASDGVRLRIGIWTSDRPARGTVLLFPGRTEYLEKYGWLLGFLTGEGFAVAAIDWRGQGLSDRLLDNPRVGHVGDFDDYQKDVAALLAAPEVAALPGPRFLFSHSMGGAIALAALQKGTVPAATLKGTVFSAPMWNIHFVGPMAIIGAPMAVCMSRFGLAERYAPGYDDQFLPFRWSDESNPLSSDPAAMELQRSQMTSHPELGISGPSIGWVATALAACAEMRRAAMPTLPGLCLLGSDEAVVSPTRIRELTGKMPQMKLVEIDGARHEIWMERPPIKEAAAKEMRAFLDAQLQEPTATA
ncbi:alpha/beta fold hydrolase [Paracoccaceae bacterium GXU_MW_L88]